jgi:hypothetical protein
MTQNESQDQGIETPRRQRARRVVVRCALIVAALLIVRSCWEVREESPATGTRSRPAEPDATAPTPGATPSEGATPDPGVDPSAGQSAVPPAEPPAAPPDPYQAAVSIRNLADVQQGWLRITRQATTDELSKAEGQFRPAGDFTVGTTNVEEFTLDRAPLAVRSADRLIMHIDGQNLVVFPREHEHGLLTFRRSPAGTWEYVKQGE